MRHDSSRHNRSKALHHLRGARDEAYLIRGDLTKLDDRCRHLLGRLHKAIDRMESERAADQVKTEEEADSE